MVNVNRRLRAKLTCHRQGYLKRRTDHAELFTPLRGRVRPNEGYKVSYVLVLVVVVVVVPGQIF